MRNAEVTRERILEAAMREFSSFGIAGARVDRIAKAADCNKNMIYIYFESKEKLFTTVLKKHLSRVYEEIPFLPQDLPGFAVQVFDFAMANPDLMRLMTWFSLENKDEHLVDRDTAQNSKVQALLEAQNNDQVGQAFSPGFLLTVVMSIATAWTTVNPFGPFIDSNSSSNNYNEIRDYVSKVVSMITQSS
ncbi:AcrR family transcriptional regulator [Paenibacillus sp. V4I3]|uniref:TetR family transcriptional regulator n=1 Tax=unclassified Paenibacillus TaxID=185978 RepID=UPI00277E68A7|nr:MULTISPECIES: TetR family transcriptional regulator [unclassified Paenibacillus]MDQ0875978.1 AcrR family transcriptional regulator [Paenibacillus sp. V4I3]MDQ0888006.1 AcrR family transcriptional regulator [Paenibacillus sp. V4I9]